MSRLFPSIGQTLGHYRLIEQIGAGGMGVVYRARDEQLERDVALKVLPAGMLAEETARKRFRKEGLALAKLNHPNIATVHEFGSQNEIDFLVTEYIPGVTLDSRLALGALPTKEVLSLGTQLAQGLSAAHEQGIVHRDLKPPNLRLTPDRRLKILDFGLAQLIPLGSDRGLTTTLTQLHEVIGTLPYMSPEQLRGEMSDARSDIWAAGVVLYEMATGRRPFPEMNSSILIDAILNREPQSPSKMNRQVSVGLENVILKALDKDPDRRYQSARELRIDLERLSTGLAPIFSPPKKRVLAWALAGGSAFLLLSFGLNVVGIRDRVFHRGPQTSGPVGIKPRRTVAVLSFPNVSGKPDEAWISTALGEMLTTELAAGGQLRAIPGENVARMRLDLSLPEGRSYSRDTLARIHNHLGSDLVVLGSYVALGRENGGKIRVDLQLQDAAAGETIAVLSENGTEGELLDVVSRMGARLREKLGLGAISEAEASGVRASVPSNSESARLYAEGLAKLRVFDATAARGLLEKAIAADPNFALAHASLSDAWSRLGYDEKTREEAKHAFELSESLSREERLSVEARYREVTRDWPKAIEIYQSLWNFFPDDLDYGLRLAGAQRSASQSKDALQTVERLRKMPAPERDDARIDLTEAWAAEVLGDFKLEQQAAGRAAQKGLVLGAQLVLAEARAREGWAAERLGQPDKAAAAFAEAEHLYSQGGDRHGAAATRQLSGDALYDRGDFASARQNYQQALAVYRQIGAQKSIASALNALGNVEFDLGQLDGAKSHYEQTLAIAQEIGAKNTAAGALGNIANVLDNMGLLEEARKKQEEGLQAFREVGNKRGEGSTLSNLANLLSELGELEAAKQRYHEALKIVDQTGYRRGRGYILQGLADVLLSQDQLEAASKAAEEAQTIRRDLREDSNLAISNMQMAVIRLEQGRLTEPEPLVLAAIDTFEHAKLTEFGAAAHAVLTRILLAQGKVNDAQGAAQRALTLSRRTGNRPPRFDAALAGARVRAATGKANEALQDLQAMLAEATKFGYLPYQFEARLAIGEIEMQSGKSSTARPHLEALERDARAKAFLLIARKAAAAAKISS